MARGQCRYFARPYGVLTEVHIMRGAIIAGLRPENILKLAKLITRKPFA